MKVLGYKNWDVHPPAPQSFLEQLSHLHPLVAQVLYNREFCTAEDVKAFLDGGTALHAPFVMKGVKPAVDLIRREIRHGSRMVVYGDYDVDGVTASAILVLTLRSLGARAEAYIPNRADEGYGLNSEAIESLAEEHARVLITVDCGIRSPEDVALAQRLGMRVIITDHHHLGSVLPQAEAVINPRQPDCPYPFKDLAGAGVAYKLAQALLRVNEQVPLPSTDIVLDEAELLDLAALGTVADMVPLRGENHTLVRLGLEKINAAYRPGLSALMRVAGVEPGKITAETISFSLAPRINAAGRLSEAMTALELLLVSDMKQALPLAQALDTINRERQELTQQIQEEARRIVLQHPVPPLLFAASEGFSSGVVGLAASRLLDEFYRPSIVVAIDGDEARGSARSIPEFHITQALDQVEDLLVRHGGHKAAAGFTVRRQDLLTLQEHLVAIAREQLHDEDLIPVLKADAELSLGMLSWDMYYALDQLRPFGFKNPAPVFISRHVKVLRARAVGTEGRHLKLKLLDEPSQKSWDAIAFRQGEWIGQLPSWIDIAYVLQRNEWRERVSLQLNVQDIHA